MAEQLGYALAPSPLAATWAAKLLHPALEGRGTVAHVGRGRLRRPGDADAEGDGGLTGVKIAVPNADVADTIVVTAEGGRHFAVPRADATIEPARALDATRPLFTVRFDGTPGEELDRHRLRPRLARDRRDGRRRVRRRRRARDRDDRRLRQGAQAVRPRDRLLPGRLARLRADVPGDRGRALGHLLGRLGARPRPRERPAWPPTAPRPTRPTPRSTSPARALQVHGGIGFTWEHDLHLFLKRAEANAHAFGDARWHREQVAATLLL